MVGDGDVVLRRRLRGGEAEVARVAAGEPGDALLGHLVHEPRRDLRPALRVTEHGFELRAAECLDAAARVDLVDGGLPAQTALLPAEGKRAGHGMDEAELHRSRLGAEDAGRGKRGGAGSQSGTPRDGHRHKASPLSQLSYLEYILGGSNTWLGRLPRLWRLLGRLFGALG